MTSTSTSASLALRDSYRRKDGHEPVLEFESRWQSGIPSSNIITHDTHRTTARGRVVQKIVSRKLLYLHLRSIPSELYFAGLAMVFETKEGNCFWTMFRLVCLDFTSILVSILLPPFVVITLLRSSYTNSP